MFYFATVICITLTRFQLNLLQINGKLHEVNQNSTNVPIIAEFCIKGKFRNSLTIIIYRDRNFRFYFQLKLTIYFYYQNFPKLFPTFVYFPHLAYLYHHLHKGRQVHIGYDNIAIRQVLYSSSFHIHVFEIRIIFKSCANWHKAYSASLPPVVCSGRADDWPVFFSYIFTWFLSQVLCISANILSNLFFQF